MTAFLLGAVFWGSILINCATAIIVGVKLSRSVREGRNNRVVATIIHGAVVPWAGPLLAWALYQGASLLGPSLGLDFPGHGNDGVLVGAILVGFLAGFGTTIIFAAVMLYQRLND